MEYERKELFTKILAKLNALSLIILTVILRRNKKTELCDNYRTIILEEARRMGDVQLDFRKINKRELRTSEHSDIR